jgi:amidohydrolase
MHACGHDSHVTILLGLAKIMSTKKDALSGNIKLFFQPDEEGRGGAKRMIEEGCMENPHVDAAFFSHCSSVAPTGTIRYRFGSVNAASNTYTVTFRGKGTHGASPHLGTDAIVAASSAVMALQTIASRRVGPTDSVVVTVGQFEAGSAPNIIPETATIKGMIRTLNPKTREQAKNDFRQIINGVAATMNVEADIDLRDGYAATVNNDEMVKLMRTAAAKVLGEENIHTTPTPGMGTEDFGYFLQEVPGCSFHYGVGKPNAENKPVHNPGFKLDLDALPYGAAVYAQIAEDFLSE